MTQSYLLEYGYVSTGSIISISYSFLMAGLNELTPKT